MRIAEYLDIPLDERAGGVGTYIKSLSMEFVRLGHEVDIVDGSSGPRVFSNRHLLSFRKHMSIRHFHEPSTALLSFCVKKMMSHLENAVVTFHAPVLNIPLEKSYSLIMRPLYTKVRLTLTTTKRNADYLKSHGVNATVIPLWADPIFRPPDDQSRYRRRPYVLSVCAVDRFHTYKNYSLISKLGKALEKKFKIDLVHVGARDFDIPHVTHYGIVDSDRLLELYRNAMVFILPSIGPYEGFGIVAAEALSCATPILVSNGCGISEFLNSYFVSSLAEFENNLSIMIEKLLDDPRRLIDKAYEDSSGFTYDNCRKTAGVILKAI